jgi:hypothetical protein
LSSSPLIGEARPRGADRVDDIGDRLGHELGLFLVDLVAAVGIDDCARHRARALPVALPTDVPTDFGYITDAAQKEARRPIGNQCRDQRPPSSHAQRDKINLQTIDADTTAGGNQAFDFIAGAGFSGTAGELRLSSGLLLGDTNGNGIADFEIKVTGIGAGAASDFVL